MKRELYVELNKSNEVIQSKFQTLEFFHDVADILEVPSGLLHQVIIKNKGSNYTKFTLQKKSGGKREIHSPKKNLAILQKKLSTILDIVYNPHTSSHGFVRGKSIISNASCHEKKKNILNLDLKDFFPSINFGRVRGMFKTFFRFNDDVATTLANICCHHEGFLPQGAATSPIVSNIIAFPLDRKLDKLASKKGCIYTRYADDITISTSRGTFPEEIAYRNDFDSPTVLSNKVRSIIDKNGFKVNDKKTHLRSAYENLSVTGITVNEKLNVKRSYIRYIRALLHSLEVNKNAGHINEAEILFKQNYNFRQRKGETTPDIYSVLRGMISYVGQVKGGSDPVYIKLGRRFNDVLEGLEKPFLNMPLDIQRVAENNTFVIESLGYSCESDGINWEDILTEQGTAFQLKGIGLITNTHVIKEYIQAIVEGYKLPDLRVHKGKYSKGQDESRATLLYYDYGKDIAILKLNKIDNNKIGFEADGNISANEQIRIIGYPRYVSDMDISIKDTKVLNQRKTLKYKGRTETRYEVESTIHGGNSGGPIINDHNQVIAVAVKGRGEHPNEVVPISDVKYIFDNELKNW